MGGKLSQSSTKMLMIVTTYHPLWLCSWQHFHQTWQKIKI